MNFGNYDSVLQQLRGAGLLVDSLEIGRRQRVRVDDDYLGKCRACNLHPAPATWSTPSC